MKRAATVLLALLLGACGWTGWQTVQVNFRHYADEHEPYSYVQTTKQLHLLTDPLLALAHESPVNCHRPPGTKAAETVHE